MFQPDALDYPVGGIPPSRVLMSYLKVLWESWRGGVYPFHPSEWPVCDIDLIETAHLPAPRCIDIEVDDGDGNRHWHLTTGDVLVLESVWSDALFPFVLVPTRHWAAWENFHESLLLHIARQRAERGDEEDERDWA